MQKIQIVIGADECGYGSLAGPLVVCGVRAPENWTMSGLKDSKKFKDSKGLTAHQQRQIVSDELQKRIANKEISFHIAERSNSQIDSTGVAVALKDSFVEIFKALYSNDDRIITDGILNFKSYNLNFSIESIVKADDKFATVMAASIIAKAYRDSKMKSLHLLHPMYGWESNSGYGSKDHLDAINKFGPCLLHRFSYAPMKNM
jgi:ribonuclease HII